MNAPPPLFIPAGMGKQPIAWRVLDAQYGSFPLARGTGVSYWSYRLAKRFIPSWGVEIVWHPGREQGS